MLCSSTFSHDGLINFYAVDDIRYISVKRIHTQLGSFSIAKLIVNVFFYNRKWMCLIVFSKPRFLYIWALGLEFSWQWNYQHACFFSLFFFLILTCLFMHPLKCEIFGVLDYLWMIFPVFERVVLIWWFGIGFIG